MCDILIQKLKPTQYHTDFNISPTADSSWRAEDSAGIRSLLSKFSFRSVSFISWGSFVESNGN